MATRRRLGRGASNVSNTVSDILGMLLQDRMLRRRQEAQVTRQNQAMMERGALDAYEGGAAELFKPDELMKMGPAAAAERERVLRRRLPESIQASLGEEPDFEKLLPPVATRSEPQRRRIAEASDPTQVPSGLQLEGFQRGVYADPATSVEGFEELERLISEASGKRGELERMLSRTAVDRFDDEQGRMVREFRTTPELAELGAVPIERTDEQQAQREAASTGATTAARLDEENRPEREAQRVREAGRTAGAQEGARNTPNLIQARVEEERLKTRARKQEELAGSGLTQQQQQAALALSDDYEQRSADFFKLADATSAIAQLGARDSPTADMGIVFTYMKVLDPNSTVTQGEQATASNAAGVPTRVMNYYNNLRRGTGLTPEQRKDFLDTARAIYRDRARQQKDLDALYTARAEQFGVDPSLVVREYQEPNIPMTDLERLRQMGVGGQ